MLDSVSSQFENRDRRQSLASIARRVSSSRAGGSKCSLSRYFVAVSRSAFFLEYCPVPGVRPTTAIRPSETRPYTHHESRHPWSRWGLLGKALSKLSPKSHR